MLSSKQTFGIDSVAFNGIDDIYTDNHHWLVSWLHKKLGCAHNAADVAHDTFIRLLLLPDITALKTPRAYLTTTATHLMIDQARRRKLEQAYLDALTLIYSDNHAYSPEDYQEAIDILFTISKLLDGLPEKVKRAFLLSRLEDASHAEIAQQLGVSTRMVKQYIARVLVHCYMLLHGNT